MKKYLKIIGVNLILLFIILLFLEVICHFLYYKNYVHQKFNIKYFKSKMVDMSWFNPDESVYKEKNNTKKRPISTIGCSFVAGVEERDKTFASELNRRTGRKTYNRGQSATGPTMMFYQLQHEDLKKEIPDAEYVIYIYIDDHINRLFKRLTFCINETLYQPIYSEKNGELILKKPHPVFYPSYLVKIILYNIAYLKSKNERKNNLKFFLKMMDESNKKVHQLYPNSHFVFIEYHNIRNYPKLSYEIIEKIKDMGIIYINAEEILGEKIYSDEYKTSDGHPNYAAYQRLTDELIKKLNL